MQIGLTLETNYCPVKRSLDFVGARVPWEVAGYLEDSEIEARGAGFYDLSFWNSVEISGPDAQDYLNRMTTVDFKSYPSERVAPGAFLTGRGQVISLGQFLKLADSKSDRFLYLVSPPQGTSAAEHIEKFHFGENLTVTETSDRWALFALSGASVDLRDRLGIPPRSTKDPVLQILRAPSVVTWTDAVRPGLEWCLVDRAGAEAFLEKLKAAGVPLLGDRLFEYHRIEAGIPRVGIEVSDKDIVLEAGLDWAVSRNKGCYPGQEVVERIFTYGQVNRKLLRVEVRGELKGAELPLPIFVAEKQVATLMSAESVPGRTDIAMGLAYVHRLYWDRAESFPETKGLQIQIRPNI